MRTVTSAIALDLGTTTIKAGLLARDGSLGGIVARPSPAVTADGGRYESDALAYAETAEAVLSECLAQTDGTPPLGLCSQRSSFLIWERAGGRPVTPLISWQDNRGEAACTALRDQESTIRDLTGLPLTPYYLAPKLHVLLREHPSWRERLASGEWLLGTLDTFLIWRWTGGRHYLTDASMAARTLLMDIRRQQWSPLLCELFGVPGQALPEIRASAGWSLRLDNGLTLKATLADQSAALIASISEGEPEALVNLGTGGFVIRYLPSGRDMPGGYLRSLVWQGDTGPARFACEGTLNSIAPALAPYDVEACRAEDLARGDIFCLAEPGGLGAPYFRKDLGLTFSAPVGQLPEQRVAVLLLEGIVFRVALMLEEMHRELGIERVYLSGGLSGLRCLQQGIAACVPFAACYRLLQSDAGLVGAGTTLAGGRKTEKIETGQAPALYDKYGRWKEWLAGLIRS
jgi:glycerol kinase